MDKLNAVLIDDDDSRIDNFKIFWEDILSEVYDSYDVKTFNNVEDPDKIFKDRPHVVIVDNVFVVEGKENSNIGLKFIKDNKEKYSDIVFVLFTGNSFQVDSLGMRFPNPDILVSKGSLPNDNYRKYISYELSRALKRIPCGDVQFSEASDHFKQKELQPHIHSILEQCTSILHGKNGNKKEFVINLRSLTGGYSGSYVYYANIVGIHNMNSVPFVFKLGDKSNVEREVDNYNSNVRLNMPHDMRVDLVGYGETDKFSGVLYSFAFGQAQDMALATDLLVSDGEKVVQLIIDKLLLSNVVGWYKNVNEVDPISIFYSNSEEYGLEKDAKRLEGLENNLSLFLEPDRYRVDDEKFAIEGHEFSHMRRILGQFDREPVFTSLCHGDLNTNNIFIDAERSSISTIDFEYSTNDMIFKDFISVESSVRAYGSDDSQCFSDLFNSEYGMLKKSEQAACSGYLSLIDKIRHSASSLCENQGLGDFETKLSKLYYAGLMMHLYKLLGLNAWDEEQSKRLVAALCAVAVYLQDTAD